MSDFADYAPARRVDGGIKARSTRGDIGESWWSRRFLDVLESFALGSRLTRGRRYARAGQVLSLDVAPGRVEATVQGSRPQPYHVSIGLKVFGPDVWTRVERELAAQAIFSAQLLAGELPGDIETVFTAAGAPLFPTALADLAMACSCPDGAVPCKHLAATVYLLAEAFDDDPFQVLLWRGRDRPTLLGNLRELRTGAPAAVEESAPPREVTGAAGAVAGIGVADEPPERFWLSPVPLDALPSGPDTEPDLLLRQLPMPERDLGGAALLAALRQHYGA